MFEMIELQFSVRFSPFILFRVALEMNGTRVWVNEWSKLLGDERTTSWQSSSSLPRDKL